MPAVEGRANMRFWRVNHKQTVSVAGETFLIAGAVAGLLRLDAQALHSVFLVGDNLSGKR